MCNLGFGSSGNIEWITIISVDDSLINNVIPDEAIYVQRRSFASSFVPHLCPFCTRMGLVRIVELRIDFQYYSRRNIVSISNYDSMSVICYSLIYARIHCHLGTQFYFRKAYGEYDGSLYFLSKETKLDWGAAEHICRRLGGDLARIDSQAEQNFVQTLLTTRKAAKKIIRT